MAAGVLDASLADSLAALDVSLLFCIWSAESAAPALSAACAHAPEEGPLRYGRIEETVDGISQKMLSQRLRRMTEDGLIARWAYEEIPPRVEYELTDLGRSLLPVAQALVDWVADNYATVEEHHR